VLSDPQMVPDGRDTYTVVSQQFLEFMKQRIYDQEKKVLFWVPRLCIKDAGIRVKFEMSPIRFHIHFIPSMRDSSKSDLVLTGASLQISRFHTVRLLKEDILEMINIKSRMNKDMFRTPQPVEGKFLPPQIYLNSTLRHFMKNADFKSLNEEEIKMFEELLDSDDVDSAYAPHKFKKTDIKHSSLLQFPKLCSIDEADQKKEIEESSTARRKQPSVKPSEDDMDVDADKSLFDSNAEGGKQKV